VAEHLKFGHAGFFCFPQERLTVFRHLRRNNVHDQEAALTKYR
jgi:hypothetical protein